MSKKIYVSPSDQTKNSYAAGNTNEAVQCRQIAQYLVTALKRCGLEAKTNLTASMADRVTESDAMGADLHIAVHTNAFNEKVTGTRLMSYDLKGDGYKACKAIFDVLAPLTPGTSENITAHPELYEIRKAKAPTAYLEIDFHDVDEIALWIINRKEEIAEAICEGVCSYFGVKYIAPTTSAKNDTAAKIDRYNKVSDMPEWARKEAQELIDSGALKGDENGNLNLSEDMLRVLLINKRYAEQLNKKK